MIEISGQCLLFRTYIFGRQSGKLEGGKLSPDVVFSSVRDIGIEKSTGSSLNVYLKSYP